MDDALAAPLGKSLTGDAYRSALARAPCPADALRVDAVSAVITGYGAEAGTIAPDAA